MAMPCPFKRENTLSVGRCLVASSFNAASTAENDVKNVYNASERAVQRVSHRFFNFVGLSFSAEEIGSA